MFRKFFSTILAAMQILLISSSCNKNYQEGISNDPEQSNRQKDNIFSQKNDIKPILADSSEKTVTLTLVDISGEKAILEFSNKTDKDVYLFYNPTETSGETTEIHHYWLRCKKNNEKEVTYNNSTSHIIPMLESLEANKSFRFEISPLPNISAHCTVSLLYYDDEKVVDLINNKILDLEDAEIELAEKAKRSAKLEFELNNYKNNL